jgi:hypothetical protein
MFLRDNGSTDMNEYDDEKAVMMSSTKRKRMKN